MLADSLQHVDEVIVRVDVVQPAGGQAIRSFRDRDAFALLKLKLSRAKGVGWKKIIGFDFNRNPIAAATSRLIARPAATDRLAPILLNRELWSAVQQMPSRCGQAHLVRRAISAFLYSYESCFAVL